MKVPIVVAGRIIGEADVYASTWYTLPPHARLDLDQAILDGKMFFELKRKEE